MRKLHGRLTHCPKIVRTFKTHLNKFCRPISSSSRPSPSEFSFSASIGERCADRIKVSLHNLLFCSEIKFSSGKVALLADGAAVVQVYTILLHVV